MTGMWKVWSLSRACVASTAGALVMLLGISLFWRKIICRRSLLINDYLNSSLYAAQGQGQRVAFGIEKGHGFGIRSPTV